ncbi:thioredoxin family protein [Halarcobacter anaerophilus]|uniref:Thiol reductase thioredoxin n=1 Tax=Halarcobacter anaerophilus TaxID=877500 RepID=A0A4Q0XXY3_9BACT|nr:thioredoxin family protein [Halarcobacter anaerophilus]QDF28141.1 thioredoxin [Halarcobacter anaerophilus]RXJ62487.1 thiol reductase thioredoxin [Halarcobacter anaerophilus]
MKQINSLEQINSLIDTREPVLVYFSGENCSVCKALKPKIEKEVLKNFPKFELREIKVDLYKEIASSFSVFSIPTIVIFFDSKEFKRYGRNISVSCFIDEIKRPYKLFTE